MLSGLAVIFFCFFRVGSTVELPIVRFFLFVERFSWSFSLSIGGVWEVIIDCRSSSTSTWPNGWRVELEFESQLFSSIFDKFKQRWDLLEIFKKINRWNWRHEISTGEPCVFLRRSSFARWIQILLEYLRLFLRQAVVRWQMELVSMDSWMIFKWISLFAKKLTLTIAMMSLFVDLLMDYHNARWSFGELGCWSFDSHRDKQLNEEIVDQPMFHLMMPTKLVHVFDRIQAKKIFSSYSNGWMTFHGRDNRLKTLREIFDDFLDDRFASSECRILS